MHRSLLRAVTTLAIVTALLGGPAAGAGADSASERKSALDRRVAQLTDQLEDTTGAYAEAARSVLRADAALEDADAALAAARERFAQARAREADLAARLAEVAAREAKARRELLARQDAQRETSLQIARLARTEYMEQGLGGVAVVLGAESAQDFDGRQAAHELAGRGRSLALQALQVQRAEADAAAQRVGAALAEADALHAEAAAALTMTRTAETSAERAQSARAAVLVQRTERVRELKRQGADERRRLDAMRAEQRRLAAVLRRQAAAARRAGGGVASGTGLLTLPAHGPVTSRYGLRYHPILHLWRLHSGLDLGIACGTPVRAAAAGRVISAGWAGGYGNRVMIDHGLVGGRDLVTTYNHLSRVIVRSGTVRRGQLIALSGTTGLSTGCHLHFETLADGSYVDPARYL